MQILSSTNMLQIWWIFRSQASHLSIRSHSNVSPCRCFIIKMPQLTNNSRHWKYSKNAWHLPEMPVRLLSLRWGKNPKIFYCYYSVAADAMCTSKALHKDILWMSCRGAGWGLSHAHKSCVNISVHERRKIVFCFVTFIWWVMKLPTKLIWRIWEYF